MHRFPVKDEKSVAGNYKLFEYSTASGMTFWSDGNSVGQVESGTL